VEEDIYRLISGLYDGVHVPSQWDTAMEHICEIFDAKWLLVAAFDERKKKPTDPSFYRVPNSRFVDGWKEYSAETFKTDPTNHYAAKNPAGGIFDLAQSMSYDDYFQHGFVRWNQANMGSSFWQLRYAGHDGLRLGVSLHRSAESGPLTNEDNKLFGVLFEHMSRAARLAARPPIIEGPEMLAVLDRSGHVISMSRTFEIFLSAGDGLVMRRRSLRPTSVKSASALDHALARVIRPAHGIPHSAGTLIEREKGPPLFAIIDPIVKSVSTLPTMRPAATIRLICAQDSSPPRADWKNLFGFTAAECRLAKEILSGNGNLRAVAGRLGIAYATARVQLSSLFQKADVRSQVSLVKLLTKLG
jgi:DNA-binding CsgD family transcriptional regulator